MAVPPQVVAALIQAGLVGLEAGVKKVHKNADEKREEYLDLNPEMEEGQIEGLRRELSTPLKQAATDRSNRQQAFLAATGTGDGATLAAVREAEAREEAKAQENVATQLAVARQRERDRKKAELEGIRGKLEQQRADSMDDVMTGAATVAGAYGQSMAAEADFAKFGSKLGDLGITDDQDIAVLAKAYQTDPKGFAVNINTDPDLMEIIAKYKAE